MARKKTEASKVATIPSHKKKPIAASSASGLPYNLLLDVTNGSSLSRSIQVETLHPGAVFVARRFFDSQECQAWIDFAKASGEFERVAHPATRYIAQRECGRWQRNDADMAQRLFHRIQSKILPQILSQLDFPPNYHPVTCNANLRLYKYEKGMSFGKHYDGADTVDQGQTEITVLVYLSSCQGGATRFYPPRKKQSIAFVPEEGAILMHIHGDRCLQHEADAVLQGVKYVLRTDIVYARG